MNGPAVNVVDLAARRRTADRQQADYYRRLLEDQRTQVQEELTAHSLTMATHQRAGDLSGVKRVRRLVRAREIELNTLNYLVQAIEKRFGPFRPAPH